MRARLIGSYLSLTVLVLLVLEIPLGARVADHERDQLVTQVERDAVVLSTLIEDSLQERTAANFAPIERYATESDARVVVVDQQGLALFDSGRTDGVGRSFASRPEIERALAGRVASGTRGSATLQESLLYVAVPVASAGTVYGAVRVTYPATELDRRVHRYWLALAGIAASTLAVAVLVGIVLARSVTRPLRRVAGAATALGEGDLQARVGAPPGPPIVRDLAHAFDDMASRLEELVGAQDAFVADASHQLRNPLLALRLRLENLRAEVEEGAVDDLDAALEEVARLSHIVDGLLALARAERGGAPGPAAPVDLVELTRGRRDEWAPLAGERGVTLVVDAPYHPVLGLVTPDRFTQVLDNLLANALDVAPPSSSITLAVRTGGPRVVVHVIDEGPGLSPADREHAFDRFWRSSNAPVTSLSGSGLGLSIVHKLVAADGGEVELAPATGGGVDAVVRVRHP